ncbi:MAG: hypothetical protein OXI52_02560 [Caldilineaceae bacterium]|nr:hypothetical protein [Caldilineaceae bacterium]
MKFGGTSVGPTESIDGVARIVAAAVEKQAGGADAGVGLRRRGGRRREGRHKACPYRSGVGDREGGAAPVWHGV